MIEPLDPVRAGADFVVRLKPNRSSSARGVAAFFAALAGTALAVALFSAAQGNVYAPLFALLYMGLVGAGLRRAWRKLDRQELIAVSGQAVTVRCDPPGTGVAARFHPYWVRLQRVAGRTANEHERLVLTSHGRKVEIGAFLADEERLELERRLRDVLVRYREPPAHPAGIAGARRGSGEGQAGRPRA